MSRILAAGEVPTTGPVRFVRHEVVDSTNEVAKALVAEGASPWTVTVAEKQVEGRGRFGRRWASPRGGLYLSVLLQDELSRLPIISIAAGLSVVDAFRSLHLEATLKWPNDVLVGGRKVAGVLVEGVVGPHEYWAIVGIGINSDFPKDALPSKLSADATTLRHELGRRVDNESLLQELVGSLRENYPAAGTEERVVARYRTQCSTIGREVRVKTRRGILEGRAVDVDTSGFLILETEEGKSVVVAEGSIEWET